MRDELDYKIEDWKADSELPIQDIIMRAMGALIPFAGGSLSEILNGRTQRRDAERLRAVVDEMNVSLKGVDANKVDRNFFWTEEFQTIAFLLIERLRTTHSADKLKMFGNALANAASVEFADDDKELFTRILCDLSLGDLHVLAAPELLHERQSSDSTELARLCRLQGMGLVLDRLKPVDPLRSFGVTPPYLAEAPTRLFRRSDFGQRFLQFVSSNPA